MSITQPSLPYKLDALAPHMSKETLEYHYGKHHKAYVDKLNGLLVGTEFENQNLENIILQSNGGIFNNAAQVWNHSFFWQCLTPDANTPSPQLQTIIEKNFDSMTTFKEQFTQAALGQFGSGWAWLSQEQNGKLVIHSTSNAGTPMTEGKKALLTCDVWEHAYYIDTRNNRAQYIENFWQLVNWSFVESQL